LLGEKAEMSPSKSYKQNVIEYITRQTKLSKSWISFAATKVAEAIGLGIAQVETTLDELVAEEVLAKEGEGYTTSQLTRMKISAQIHKDEVKRLRELQLSKLEVTEPDYLLKAVSQAATKSKAARSDLVNIQWHYTGDNWIDLIIATKNGQLLHTSMDFSDELHRKNYIQLVNYIEGIFRDAGKQNSRLN
jgi:hypothetical protein